MKQVLSDTQTIGESSERSTEADAQSRVLPEDCWLCDEQWPMSRDLSGVHDIEADSIYGTANCLKPSERARRLAREEKAARELEEFEQGEITRHGTHALHRAGCPSCRAEAARR